MSTYALDITNLTVIATDAHGERFDLNAQGARCRDFAELRDFINELRDEGAFGEEVRGALLTRLAAYYPDAWGRSAD